MMSERCSEMTSGQPSADPGLLMFARSSLPSRHTPHLHKEQSQLIRRHKTYACI